MSEPLTVERATDAMSGAGTVEAAGPTRLRVRTTAASLQEALRRAGARLGCDHFIQLASVDTGKEFELHYHMTGPHRTVVTVTVTLPRDAPVAPTASAIFAPCGLYERQVHDLMGVEFEGHPDLKRFILNDEWPPGEHPMRKDWKPREGVSYGGPCAQAACGPVTQTSRKETGPCPKS